MFTSTHYLNTMRNDFRTDAQKLESIALIKRSRDNSTSVALAAYSECDRDEDEDEEEEEEATTL